MTIFYITDFQIDLSRSVIIKGDQETQVEPKVLQVLSFLAQRQGQVVTHKELMDHVWQGSEVVPNALQRCIGILRKALGDNAKAPKIIDTHPRIGYRLLVDVRWSSPSNQPETYHQNMQQSAHHSSQQSSQQNLQQSSRQSIEKNTEQNAEPLASTSTLSDDHHDNGDYTETSAGNRKKYPSRWLIVLAVVIATLAVAAIFISSREASQAGSLLAQYSQIRQLTQTDAHEIHAIYSPNSEYIVFNRDAGACKSHLWAKHIGNGKENQLTAEPGAYGSVSFTEDGRELVFAARTHCQQSNVEQLTLLDNQQCWNIASLDFAMALSTPTMPSLRHQCQAERLENPKALSNHQYAFLQYNDGRYQLMHYDDLSKKLTSLYHSQEQYIYHFDYDPSHQRFAVISRNENFNTQIQLLDINGQLLSSSVIQLAQGMSQHQNFAANFEPNGRYLLATSNKRLYKIEFNGELLPVTTPENNLVSVAKHQNNTSLLAVKGKKDIDIAQVILDDKASLMTMTAITETQQPLPLHNLTRSGAQERGAQYQPNGDYIAFIADTSGQDELWLWHPEQGNRQATQLSFLSSQTGIKHFSWSPDGQHLAWVSDDKLVITDLEGKVRVVDNGKPLDTVATWYDDNQLLVLINDPVPSGLYRLSLDSTNARDSNKTIKTNELIAFNINHVEATWVIQNQLIYSTINGEVFTRSLSTKNAEVKRLPELNGKALFVSGGLIYSVNQENLMLNQYSLQGQLIQPITPLNAFAWKVSGLKNNRLLLSKFVAINHDIVTLH